MALDQLFAYDGWFAQKYQNNLSCRWPTMHAALNLWKQRGGHTIVETGCVRLESDWGAGMSTPLFCDVIARHGGYLWTVDLSERNMAHCEEVTRPYESQRTCRVGDSVDYLANRLAQEPNFPGVIDLLYLDSFDYPFGEILNDYGGREDLGKAIIEAQKVPEAEIVAKYGDVIGPCQQHCLDELEAAWPFLNKQSVILIDDNNLAGGGKPRLAKFLLIERGWRCLLDHQQTLWIKA